MIKIVDLILWWNRDNFQEGGEPVFKNNLIEIELDRKDINQEGFKCKIIMIEEDILIQGNNNFKQGIRVEIDNIIKYIYKICTICTIIKWCNYTMAKMGCHYLSHQFSQCFNIIHNKCNSNLRLVFSFHNNRKCLLQIIQFFLNFHQNSRTLIKVNDYKIYLLNI